MSGLRGRAARPGSIIIGMMRVARGRSDGIAEFGNTTQSFLASLAPLIAFPLVGTVLVLSRGGGLGAMRDFAAAMTALLAPPVISYEVARLFKRTVLWPRYATAFNWCQWLLPVLGSVALLGTGMLMAMGIGQRSADILLMLALGGYALWLHWFLARHALDLSAWQAALTVLCVNAGTLALVLLPRLAVMEAG